MSPQADQDHRLGALGKVGSTAPPLNPRPSKLVHHNQLWQLAALQMLANICSAAINADWDRRRVALWDVAFLQVKTASLVFMCRDEKLSAATTHQMCQCPSK